MIVIQKMFKVTSSGIAFCHPDRLEPPIDLRDVAHQAFFRVSAMADCLGITSGRLSMNFRRSVGLELRRWLKQERLAAARALVQDGYSPSQIATMLKWSNAVRELRPKAHN